VAVIGSLPILPIISGALAILFLLYTYNLERFSADARIDACIYVLKKTILKKEQSI
jgi:hypothetical protein